MGTDFLTYTIQIAGLAVEIHSFYRYAYEQCRAYLVDAPGQFVAAVSMEEIQRESANGFGADYAEFICIYRKIAEQLPFYQRFVIHGAGIAYRNQGYLFCAPSGTGKTTHIALWQRYAKDVSIINGDKPILWMQGDQIFMCGTPWAGKEDWQSNQWVPLRKLCFLKQGKENRMISICAKQALSRMLQQIYLPKDQVALCSSFALLDQLLRKCSFYELSCDISKEAFLCSYQTLYEEETR